MLREALPDVDLTLTTNGSALKAKAQALKDAGLKRITVSLDSLDDATFRAMNDADFPVAKVLEAIDAAAEAGLAPVKVNMVVKRGVNDHQVVDMARRFRGTGHIVRFIEFMDVGSTNHWRMDDVIPSAEIVRRISKEFPLEPVDANYEGEVAERWRYRDGAGRDRRDLVGHPGLLLDLHARAPLHRRAALHLPVRATRLRPEGAAARRHERRRDLRLRSPPSGRSATTATPRSAPPRPRRRARSRCRTSAAESWHTARFSRTTRVPRPTPSMRATKTASSFPRRSRASIPSRSTWTRRRSSRS